MIAVPKIALASLVDVGSDLRRPECVLCTSDGAIVVSDWSGGVTQIAATGEQKRIVARNAPVELRPNGIALQEDGSVLLANLGADGGVWRLSADGDVEPYLLEVDGERLPPCNFVLPDRCGRVWITVSTRRQPRAAAYRTDVADGFVIVVDAAGARIAADGLAYTNEVQVSPDGEWLYVNETFGRRLTRMPIDAHAALGKAETVVEFGAGVFPDGLCFDEEGGIWVVSIVSNQVLRIAPDGNISVIVDDADAAHVARVEAAFVAGEMGRQHLDRIASERLRNISSIAFGGADRRLSYLGCLLGDRVVSFRSPVAGSEPVHWHWRVH